MAEFQEAAPLQWQRSVTDEMAAQLLQVAQRERRYPRQQVEVLLEQALHAALQSQTDPVAMAERLIEDVERASRAKD